MECGGPCGNTRNIMAQIVLLQIYAKLYRLQKSKPSTRDTNRAKAMYVTWQMNAIYDSYHGSE